MEQHLIVPFGSGAEAPAGMGRNELGGKGGNLVEMAAIGLPVPPGFVIPTMLCHQYYDAGSKLPDALVARLADGMAHIEGIVGRQFGSAENPLLVSVRSGARVSMPGMMDTVLNLGLNDETVVGLATQSGNARFAWDSYRRFVQMYADVVLGISSDLFEDALAIVKDDRGVSLDTELDAAALQELVGRYRDIVRAEYGRDFPQDPTEQLQGAVGAVFGSWRSERAIVYRRMNNIPDAWGTAVTVQAMVFGNMGETSATGVAFTRNPATGDKQVFGEYLVNAQGEDVVAGIRTPHHLTQAARQQAGTEALSLQEEMPAIYAELAEMFARLEGHYRDCQDIEFTVQEGQLWLLQTRNGKRTARAALKMASDMVDEGLISRDEAVLRVDPAVLDQLLHPALDPDAPREVVTRGLPASPGAASGAIVFDSETAAAWAGRGEDVILVRTETSPEDIAGMYAARGILTARGGMTSHAAVVARGMGRPCVSGASRVAIDAAARAMRVGGKEYPEGTLMTLDGSSGEVLLGRVPTTDPELSGDFARLMQWADGIRRLRVRANAETADDCRIADSFDAEGIGLARTEHMFFGPERIVHMRAMILAVDETGRRAALANLLPLQRADFAAIFELMHGRPVTVRLLDPPLHEFLPRREEEIAEVAAATGLSAVAIRRRLGELHESNPMLGHRGCRLLISYPEIVEMQVRAILEAALGVEGAAEPEIMVPLVATAAELAQLRQVIERTAEQVFADAGRRLKYHVGTMIELPRAALRAGDIAEYAEFFSFGTNDLTQTTLGVSRDDAGSFLGTYVDRGIYARDPFVSLDVEGVGELLRIGVERGRAAKPGLKVGICGEHGGDPATIAFCDALGLDYVSCSPWRVPIARLAAAQAALRHGKTAA